MLAALLFDFDGTIAETERLGHRVAYNDAFAESGLDWNWDEQLYGELLAIGGGKERIAAYIEHHRPTAAPPDRAALIAALHKRKQAIFAQLVGTIAFRPGVQRLVGEARRAGIRLAIVTTAAPSGVEALLGRDPDLRAAFELVAAGDIVPRKKPAPDIYRYALDRLGVTAGACIAVEDSAIGLRASRAAGIATLVTMSDYTRGEDFSGAAAVVDRLGDPGVAAHAVAGPPLPQGLVDLAYLRSLLDEPLPQAPT